MIDSALDTHVGPHAREAPRYAEYDRFASIYDSHFGQFARSLVPVLDRLVLGSLPEMARILDLCCGTGQLAAALTERGFVVTGVDGSEKMLRLARRNAPAAEFLVEDVRTLDLPDRFDAAVSTFDSINHIVELGELKLTFANVYRALRPGGRFVFDMNMEEGYRCRWWGTWHGAADGRECVIRAIYCPETKLGRNIVTWAENGAVAPPELTFVERCYSETAVRDALTEAGFRGIRAHDGHRDLGLFGELGRFFFICQKPVAVGPAEETVAQTAVTSGSPRRRSRDIATCVEDSLWPGPLLLRELGMGSRRLQALEEVLTTLPAQPYEGLKQEAGRFAWFIPSDRVLGQVHPFQAVADRTPTEPGSGPWARVVYLSPLLEQQARAVVVTVVAHELAHVVLGHRLIDLDRDAYDDQEDAAREAVCSWGFRWEMELAEHALARCIHQVNGYVSEAVL
jgi:SAM-dependent methyltransferase